MIQTDLSTLKINKLTQAQYDAAKAAGTLSETELYMTPTPDASGYALKSVTEAVTLAANKWDAATKVYSFETEYPNDSYNLTVFLNGDSATDEQIEAWNNLSAVGSYSRNVITAKNVVPTVDIPVVLEVTHR